MSSSDAYSSDTVQLVPSYQNSQSTTPSSTSGETPKKDFADKQCLGYMCACLGLQCLWLIGGLACFMVFYFAGVLVSSIASAVVTLSLARYYFHEQVTVGQITLCFFEAILWYAPVGVLDLVWLIFIRPLTPEYGLCLSCVVGYLIRYMIFAALAEQMVKYMVVFRIFLSPMTNGKLTRGTPDIEPSDGRSSIAWNWKALVVYGACVGAGMGAAENILKVLVGGWFVAFKRTYSPFHVFTGLLTSLLLIRSYIRNPIAYQQAVEAETKDIFLPLFPPKRVFCEVFFAPFTMHFLFDFVSTILIQSGVHSIIVSLISKGIMICCFLYCRYLYLDILNYKIKSLAAPVEECSIHQSLKTLCEQPFSHDDQLLPSGVSDSESIVELSCGCCSSNTRRALSCCSSGCVCHCATGGTYLLQKIPCFQYCCRPHNFSYTPAVNTDYSDSA